MPIAKLIFNLPEEENEFKLAGNAIEWALTVFDMDQYLREQIKYERDGLDINTLEVVRSALYVILKDHNLNLESIG